MPFLQCSLFFNDTSVDHEFNPGSLVLPSHLDDIVTPFQLLVWCENSQETPPIVPSCGSAVSCKKGFENFPQ
ncbi:hypothetical protein L6452_32354 [Arctium lappa]|uniref:Uncharacterized protein n=1 Tax=Arctium lappa TaxID=4217 RepID=A0ACB8Z445_ARCLA|nr:hypothetical protein L6452_32354 [Arctium lappa]